MAQKATIIGGGFGLYGYLPALFDSPGLEVLLPSRYRLEVSGRPELNRFVPLVTWVEEERKIFDQVDFVIIAVNPTKQVAIVTQLLQKNNIATLILEKPIAPTPKDAESLLGLLESASVKFRIGYNFRYTLWFKRLAEILGNLNSLDEIRIDWEFSAHHYKKSLSNWKRYNSSGGGVLRFYGIHVIAILAELGYTEVSSSMVFGENPDDIYGWRGLFKGESLPGFNLWVDSKSKQDRFSIGYSSEEFSGLKQAHTPLCDPFELEKGKGFGEDKRVPCARKIIESVLHEEPRYFQWYYDVIKLWREAEKVGEFLRSREVN